VAAPKIQMRFNYLPLLVDTALRYLTYFLWHRHLLWNTWFWILQLVVIPLGIFMWQGLHGERLAKRLGVGSNGYEVADRADWIVFVLLLAAHDTILTFHTISIQTFWLRSLTTLILSVCAILYVMMIGFISASDTIQEPAKEDSYEAYDTVDENDRLLIRLDTEIEDFIRKVEAYTIESTLIGAISFSAFVTIVTSGKASVESAGHLTVRFLAVADAVFARNGGALRGQFTHYPSESMILSVAACSALICSMFFMVVMVARLRFNALTGPASFSTQMATNFNSKEEEIARYMLLEAPTADPAKAPAVLEERLVRLRKQITFYLDEGRVEVEQMRAIIGYMTIFRTLGLIAFLVTLVVSAMWFAPRLSIFFGLMAFLTYAYPMMDGLIRDRKLRSHDFFRLERFFKH
jgi:hypothetical protein